MPVFEVVDFDGGLLIGARRNADHGKYYWRITPWIMPLAYDHSAAGGAPSRSARMGADRRRALLGLEHQLPPGRALSASELKAMKDGAGIHVKYVPGTFVPLANKSNDYLLDRAMQRHGRSYSGVEGIAMQDASLQESMGPIQDRTREHLCMTGQGNRRDAKPPASGGQAAREGKSVPGLDPVSQRVRSCAIELPVGQQLQGRREARSLSALDTDPVTV